MINSKDSDNNERFSKSRGFFDPAETEKSEETSVHEDTWPFYDENDDDW